MLRSWVLGFALVTTGCGGESGFCDESLVRSGAASYASPVDLVSLAGEVRGAGGVVFRGVVVETRVVAPQLAPVVPGSAETLVTPRVEVTVRVVDALGSGLTGDVAFNGTNEPQRVVDARGCPTDYRVSEALPPPGIQAPTAGEWVFFVYVRDGQRRLAWRASVTGDQASNDGTLTEGTTPIEALRASP
ncbi:MAG: hypothetical protein R3A52_06295 [Polyangiales bacterium]